MTHERSGISTSILDCCRFIIRDLSCVSDFLRPDSEFNFATIALVGRTAMDFLDYSRIAHAINSRRDMVLSSRIRLYLLSLL